LQGLGAGISRGTWPDLRAVRHAVRHADAISYNARRQLPLRGLLQVFDSGKE